MNVCESKHVAGSTANVDTDVASGDLEQIRTDTEELVFNRHCLIPMCFIAQYFRTVVYAY